MKNDIQVTMSATIISQDDGKIIFELKDYPKVQFSIATNSPKITKSTRHSSSRHTGKLFTFGEIHER